MTSADDLLREAEGHLAAGRTPEAERICQAVLGAMPDHPGGLMLLNVIWVEQQRWVEAEALLLRGCAVYANSVAFHAALGNLRVQMNNLREAMEPIETCVLLDPDTRDHRATLVAIYRTVVFVSFSERSKRAMTACLADEALTHSLMNKAWLSLLRVDPESADVVKLLDASDYESFKRQIRPEHLSAWQGNDFLNGGLNRMVVADPAIERGLTFARRWLFENRDASGATTEGPTTEGPTTEGPTTEGPTVMDNLLPLLCTLARYCFLTEYVFPDAEDHTRLRNSLLSAARVALLGCYEPLFAHDDAERFATLSAEPCYGDLVRIQVLEPRVEARLKETIPAWTPIDDDVSRAVRDQYEQNPYPRWVTVGGGLDAAANANDRLLDRTILVAGCGTGREAVEVALRFPSARVEAVDLSRASLAYAVRKSREMGATNVSFGQADILQLRRLGRTFDLILSSGVIHHMKDPAAGLRALLDRLRPGGIVRLGLYSTIARTAVAEARAWIQSERFKPTLQGIRDFRAGVLARSDDDPMRQKLTISTDFYTTSQCRDCLFHVQERTFTLPEIADLAHRFGLSVLRVDASSPALAASYRQRFPDDPAAADLAHWHALELDHPTLFSGMYSLWFCRAVDRPNNQLI